MRLAVLLLLVTVATAGKASVTFEQARAAYVKSDAILYDRNGKILHESRVDSHGRRLEWVPLSAISPALQKAVIAAEDKRFYTHSGVDWRALASAFLQRLTTRNARGASTISMQVASLLDANLSVKKKRRGFWLKWRQISRARALEKGWTKGQIMETYLNLVGFRGELKGIGATSRGLFGKDAHGLDTTESLVLASLIRAPNATLDEVQKRACRLGKKLESDFDCERLREPAVRAVVTPYFIAPRIALAPHIARRLLKPGNATFVSTLDGDLQRFALESVKHQLQELKSQNVTEGAVLVADNRTGEVLAYVGNTKGHVDAIRARRQAGSTLKPFLYGLAFEERLLTAASLLDDSPLDVSVARGIYRPGNYDNRFRGLVSARVALASSLNIPAVRTLLLVGIDPFVRRLSALGLTSLEAAEYYGPSLALGSADVSLWDLVNAYRTMANGGEISPLRLVVEPLPSEAPQPIFSREAAFLVAEILSDRESRSSAFGLENPLATRFWSAVKTGTSKDMRDNWCVGFSEAYTVGVWVGNFSGDSMWNVSGISGAAPVWVQVMNWLHRKVPSRRPQVPAGLVVKRVEIAALASSRDELFLSGTEVERVVAGRQELRQRIIYPAPDTIIALDPDIPLGQQRLFFEAHAQGLPVQWWLDGKPLREKGELVSWDPRKGRHKLALRDDKGAEIDSVNFVVRF